MQFCSFSIDGPKGINQDRRLDPVHSMHGWIAAIADGVGGNLGGETAAEIAISTVQDHAFLEKFEIKTLYRNICEKIKVAAGVIPEISKMATTLSMVRVVDNTVKVSHVGDSRVYHIRNNGIITRTVDQTEVADLLKDKVITPSQARKYPRRNVITSYLSADFHYQIYQVSFEIVRGDMIVLLTDGAHKLLKKAEIVRILSQMEDVSSSRDALKQNIENFTIKDDASVIVIKI